jgi:zinc protease
MSAGRVPIPEAGRVVGALLVAGLIAAGCGRGRESLPAPRRPLVRTSIEDERSMPIPAALPSLELPTVHTAVLETGLRVEVVERRGLPMVAVVVAARGFSPIDPLVPPGVPELAARVIDRELTRMAVTAPGRELPPPSVETTDDGLLVTTQVPAAQLAGALAQISASMRAAECHDADVVLARIAMSEEARRERTIGGLVDTAVGTTLYGAADRRAQPSYGSVATLAQLHRGHCAAQRRHGLAPGDSTIAIVGDVDHEEALRLVQVAMAGWSRPSAASAAPIPPPAFPTPTHNVLLVPMTSAQGLVLVTERSPGPREPGFAAAGVMTRLLGGMFGARLNLELRERRGWAYGVGASRSVSSDHASVRIECTVEGARMVETLAAIDAEIARLSDPRSIGADELATAIAMERGALLDQLETRAGVARALAVAFLRRSSIAHLAELDAELARLGAGDVARVASAFRRDAAAVVLIGSPALGRELERARPGRFAIIQPR